MSADWVDVLIGKASWFNNGSTIEMSAVDAVVLGGRLSVLSDEVLRRRVAGWSRLVTRVTRTEAQDYDKFSEVWMPYLRSHAYLPQIHNASEVQPGGVGDNYIPDVPVGPRRTLHVQLLADREFENVLLQTLWVERDILEEYGRVVPALDSLINVLDARLH